MDKTLPFDKQFITQQTKTYPTPFYIYDEKHIRANASSLKQTMDAAKVPGFKNFFAVKALPNPEILKVLREEGMGADCSSLAELELARRAGFEKDDIMFT